MFRSVFLRRILLIVMITLLFSALLSSGLFLLASAQYSRADLLNTTFERAENLSIYLNTHADQIHSQSDVSEYFLEYDLFSSYVLIYDSDGNLMTQSNEVSDFDTSILIPTKLHVEANWLNNSDYVYLQDVLPLGQFLDQIIIVQTPLYTSGELSAYVVVATPTQELSRLLTDFLNILLLSTLFVALAMLMPVYFATMRLVLPLRKVTTIAQAMGQGDFSIRADSNAKGEIGELAKSFNDLSDRLSKSITDLTVERNRLREIFDVISEGIVSVDTKLRPQYTNPAIKTLFENARRKNLFTERLQIIPFEEIWDDMKQCISEKQTIERTINEKENSYLSTIVPTFDNEGTIIGATGFFRDITESERLEQTRRDYIANVSHELRTPLTALRGLVEPLADGMVRSEADRKRYYGIILHETMRLSRLIDDMLELSRLQARTLAFRTFPFDLNALLKEIETKFEPVMNDAELHFRVEFKSGKLPTVMGNPDRVEQILIILMDNAKKYTPPGGSITISTGFDNDNNQVLVSVIDTGQGIHEYDIDHIFDRFYKADRARGKKGTGLGLSIARELLSYMGETISVTSEYGEGTTFTFTLKRVQGTVWY
ncbi:MAG: cell wall metabolism sensor histidine kinase WalK [Clostridiaceae bacterium]|nr:cell wall metabolism sensor histidine kinase WalK [Clostridiaceae bacterium]